MQIYTSSWFTNLPPEIQKIGVSRGTPRGYPAGFRKMPELAPGSWFNSTSVPQYKQLFFEGLAKLNPRQTVAKMEDLSAGRDCALLCYEAPTKDADWCHRGYISAWLKDTLGLDVFEYGLQDRGSGWRHPKIPLQYRAGYSQPEPLAIGNYIGATAKDDQGREWTIVGLDPSNLDQAMMQSGDEKRAISSDVLKARFRPLL